VIFSSRDIPRAICNVLFVKDAVARDHTEVIDHWIEAWNDALNFRASNPENHLRVLNRLNGTPTRATEKSFSGIFFTNLTANRRIDRQRVVEAIQRQEQLKESRKPEPI
jgi:ABC-type nitrate/sulfonate/bicarbonate transport system substrate-binding protein